MLSSQPDYGVFRRRAKGIFMAIPKDAALPQGVELKKLANGQFDLSQTLVDLLVDARRAYDWPSGTGSVESQQAILDLEEDVARLMNQLNADDAHVIVQWVSDWAGNNTLSRKAIEGATADVKARMLHSLKLLNSPGEIGNALASLCHLPGVGLVVASKIYRFCYPEAGAAVDRHASYFFNSLDIVDAAGNRAKALHFRREWSTGRRTTSRLAIYNLASFTHNLHEFVSVYLPWLASIAATLNVLPAPYTCAATGELKAWRPSDVEMAAYYWWACNGAR